MPNNSLQFVTNGEDYIQDRDPGRKGEEKDFFEDRDADFRAHQDVLTQTLTTIDQAITRAGYGPAAYVRATLREAALAKSYRPNSALFTPDRFPCVGAGAIGEIFFFLPQVQFPELVARIRRAEATVPVTTSRTGRVYRTTTRLRSEVGAIESIEILPATEKRLFSAAEAVHAFVDPNTFPGYQVELFEVPPLNAIETDRWGRRQLFESLFGLLTSLGNGTRSYLLPAVGRTPMLEVQLTRSPNEPALLDLSQLATTSAELPATVVEIDTSLERHETALDRLASHPLVRRIDPPVRLTLEQALRPTEARAFVLPTPTTSGSYPKIGIIDSGVGAAFSAWTLGRFDHLTSDQVDAAHGSSVAGIVVAGQAANGPAIAPERDGCQVYDIALFPKLPFSFVYSGGFSDFLEEVEQGIREAKDEHGIRVFNMSINTWNAVQRNSYSTLAARLDAIADRHGVLIVNSAGNLKPADARTPWQNTPRDNLAYFAARTSPDTICQPTESVRSLSVGALNCPGGPQIADTPARYSRRGPGLQIGIKPDLVHYGGSGALVAGHTTGLVSSKADGAAVHVCGTSFAAPLIARTLAELDLSTSYFLAPRTLRALAIHHADTPEPMTKRGLKDLARQLTGFGRPPSAAEMLETPDHRITLVFEGSLPKGADRPQIMRFEFAWPAALVDAATQTCSGRVRMTLAYDPPLDPAFGAEFARVNLDAALKQQQPIPRKDGRPSFSDQATMLGLPQTTGLPVRERALIDHGLKWWPTKKYVANLNGKGTSANWRLEISSLTRAEATYPAEGVPFALILTLEDDSSTQPIFQTFRQYLRTRAAAVTDIQVAHRVRQRA